MRPCHPNYRTMSASTGSPDDENGAVNKIHPSRRSSLQAAGPEGVHRLDVSSVI